MFPLSKLLILLVFPLGISATVAMADSSGRWPEAEKAAFRKSLAILNQSGSRQKEDASLYGNISLGMSEAEFKAQHSSAKVFLNEPEIHLRSYIQGSGLRYQFYREQMFALGVIISAFSNNEAGLGIAQKSFDQAIGRAEKLFGLPDAGLSAVHSDHDYETRMWVVWRGAGKNALTLAISRPRRLSELTSTNGVATSIQITDLATSMSMSANADDVDGSSKDLKKQLQQY